MRLYIMKRAGLVPAPDMNFGFLNKKIASFHAAALILGGAAFLSRILGLFRDRLLAAHFGAGDTLDVYYAAFQIPDLLFTLFLVGAASAAVLPVFLEYERRGEGEADAFISNLLTVFSVFALAVVLFAAIAAPWLMRLIAPGFSVSKLALSVRLTRLMMMNALLLGIAGILSSVLQARHRFFVFALPPIFYNLAIIAGIVFLVPSFGVIGLAYGVVLGGLLEILVQLPAFASIGVTCRLMFRLRDPGLKKVFCTSLPRVLALSMSQITLMVLTAIASFFASGSLSAFKLASNLLYVPVGLFGVSYALAMFPKLSISSLENRGKAFREQVMLGFRNILFWALPFSALFIVLRAHIVRVVLGSGVFNWSDTRIVSATLAVLAVAIVSESILPLVLRAFYALGRTREPLMWDIVGSLTTVILALGFSALFAAFPSLLHAFASFLRIGDLAHPNILAVALGFALGSLVNVLLLIYSLAGVVRVRLGVRLFTDGRSIAALMFAAAAAGVAAKLVLLPFPVVVPTNTFLGIFAQGLVAGIAGLAVYALILIWQKNPEMVGLIGSFRLRLLSPRKTPAVYETEKLDGNGTK